MKTTFFSFILITLLFSNQIFAQKTNFDKDSIADKADSLSMLFKNLKDTKLESEKKEINNQILSAFENALALENSFLYPFDELSTISNLKSADKQMRIFTWNLAYDDGTHEYFGFVQYYLKKKKKYLTFQLHDKSCEMPSPDAASLNSENWFGALYYQLIEVKDKGKKYYTLLGWDGNNISTTKKIIEVLSFSATGKPEFGASIFRLEEGRVKRVIFEFAKQAQMSLRYDEKSKMIVFDHLSPSDAKLKGEKKYYGPDFSYDGLLFKKGKWLYVPDIDIRNPREKANKRNLHYSY